MSCQELQEEELEVLRAIYDGDENFKEIGRTCFQYKYGEPDSYKALMVEINWSNSYPEEAPTVNMDVFYNKNILDSVKQKVVEGILQQTEDFLGSAMTYTLFEWVKENYEDLVADQPNAPVLNKAVPDTAEKQDDAPQKRKEKKEQLTKHQKKRMFDKLGNAMGEKPRGWDWVDVVKHLSQTGGQKS